MSGTTYPAVRRQADTVSRRGLKIMNVDTAETLSTLDIGDRVIFRYSKTKACGTVTQVFGDGVARVLWDSEEQDQLQFGDLLIKLPELRSAG
jgi:hypothetical protein